jgi:hypothetical protein
MNTAVPSTALATIQPASLADTERVIGALRDRLPGETDPPARAAIIHTVAAFGKLAATREYSAGDPLCA